MSATSVRPLRARLALRSNVGAEVWALVGAFVVLRSYAVLRAPVHFPDSASYLPLDFLGRQARLWTVPVLYNVCFSDTLRVVAQLLIAIFAWSSLALGLYSALGRRAVGYAGVLTVLLLGLVPQVTGWDSALLSESTATSMFVLLVAVSLRLTASPSRGLLAACLGTAMLWEFTRQQNAIIFLVLAPFAVAAAIRWLRRPDAWAVSAAVCVLGAWGGYDTFVGHGDRQVQRYNALQILENRLMPDPQALRFFIARGLPASPEMMLERGAFRGGASPLYNDQGLLSWIDHRWKSAYAAYLLRHPLHTLAEPLRQTPAAISSPVSVALHERPAVPPPVGALLWSSAGGEVAFWLVVGFVLLLACYRLRITLRFAALPAALALFTVTGAEVTWTLTGYNEGPELARLFMPVAISARLGILLLIVFAADRLGSYHARPRISSANLGAHT